jgi:flavodoxin
MSRTVIEQMKQELRTELEKGYADLDDIKDRSGEWVDGYLPVYYNKIVEEWQEMPSEYNDRGAQELGTGEGGIYNLMSLDLYLYYTDLFNEAVEELEEELEEQNEAVNA